MSTDNILYEVKDRLAVMTVNRPGKLNALDSRTVKEILQTAGQAAADDSVGALIITGAGDKAFVAGADISELARQTLVEGQATSDRGQAAFSALENMDKPVIAAINGFALGGGLELALACHLRVAAANAVMGLPELGLGIIPGYGGTQRLARLVGRGHALEMILTARKVKADEAARMGLVNRVVPEGEALAGAREMAGKILAQGPLAVAFALRAVRHGLEMSLAAGQAYEASLFGMVSATDDMREGMTAFLEKRKPDFTGR
ncbi:MAG: enoyl-CoA hydratase-related protein [Acidobacteria bacterium]|nr:enoyl-CoA hydratase-related protein [Acidobacteriota bacterium]MCZ6746837.1 enoyl-CoA hydratase-related protein [Acidobacteriota bacterium]